MKLKYKIDKARRLITLEIQDEFEDIKILQYIAHELSIQNGFNSMNQRPLFLEKYEESFDKKNTLNIQYLNDDNGLLDISDVFSECFGIYMAKTWLSTNAIVEGMEDFNIPDEERFHAITNPNVSNVSSNIFQMTSENTNKQFPQTSSLPLTITEPEISITYSFDAQKEGENYLNFYPNEQESDSNKLSERELIIHVVNQLNENAIEEVFSILKDVPAFKRCMEITRQGGDEPKRQKVVLDSVE